MRKLGWFAVSAAVAAMIGFGALLLVANLYVQSQGAQQRIRQMLTTALHVPVTLKKTTLTPWEGLRLDGITLQPALLPSEEHSLDGALLTADSFRLRAAWWPLLRYRRLEVEAILLDHPRLVWAQNQEGRWVWPEASPLRPQKNDAALAVPPADLTLLPPDATTSTSSAGAPAPADREPATRVAQASSVTRTPSLTTVEKLRVRHGSFDLLNQQRKLLGRLEELNLDGCLMDDGQARGELHIGRAIHARSGILLTNFRSNFAYDESSGLSIDNGRSELAGGELQAEYRLRSGEAGSPFSARCRVDGVDLAELIREAGSQLRLMDGRLQGGFSLQGSSDNPEHRQATGQLSLVGAEIRNFPVLQLLGDMLRIQDLSHLQFKEAKLDCRLDGDELQIAPLRLASNDLQIRAEGRYSTGEDELELHGRLTIDQAISHQLPQFIEMNFTPSNGDAPGSRYIDFDVTGPLDKPTTNLFDRVLAGPSTGLLRNLLAPKSKRLHPKNPKAEATLPPGNP